MKKHYERVVEDTNKRVKRALRIQVQEIGSQFYGGFRDDNRLVEAKYAIYQVVTMIGAYSNKDTDWYQEEKLEESIRKGLSYIACVQHDNGLFDYIDCNFYSAPDTAFMLKGMFPALHYLKNIERTKEQEYFYTQLYKIGRNAAFGLLQGGFHTPNHRWAIASALYECADFFEAPELLEACAQYLNEGIDCNEDGEFAEKSAGTYNGVNDEAMIVMGDYSHEEVYYDYAIRNLRMMLTYIEPDGTVFTANSTRQDNGKRIFPTEYYWMYLRMGKEKDIPEFLSMANYIFELIEEYQLLSPDILLFFMVHPEFVNLEYEDSTKAKIFHKVYTDSGIARIGCGDYTYTVMKDKSTFLYFSNHSLDVGLKIGGSLCEHRAFIPETLEETADGFTLTQVMKGWYYLPLKEKPHTTDWWQMNHEKREKIWGPDIHIRVQVKEVSGGIDVHMKLTGIQTAPFRVEASVTGAHMVENQFFDAPAINGGYILAKEGMITVSNTSDCIKIGPGFGTHSYIAGKFGSEAQQKYGFTIYFTDYTEFEHCIQIRNI